MWRSVRSGREREKKRERERQRGREGSLQYDLRHNDEYSARIGVGEEVESVECPDSSAQSLGRAEAKERKCSTEIVAEAFARWARLRVSARDHVPQTASTPRVHM